MAEQLNITVGSAKSWPLQCWNEGGRTKPTNFAATDALATEVSRGAGQAVLLTPATAFYTAPDPITGLATQTGYTEAQVLVTAASVESAGLEANGTYLLEVWRTPQNSADRYCIWSGTLRATTAAGQAGQLVVPYNTLADMLEVAPWTRLVQDFDTDQEGFYPKRLQARQWLDAAILACYRGAFVGLFETHSTAAFAFGYAGWRRSLGPSPSLIDYLARNLLIVRPQIVRACAHHAAGLVGLSQIGINNQQASLGAYHRDEAERLLCGITCEVDLNADGIGELFISLDSTNSLFT